MQLCFSQRLELFRAVAVATAAAVVVQVAALNNELGPTLSIARREGSLGGAQDGGPAEDDSFNKPGQVFIDESLCLRGQLTAVHTIEIRVASQGEALSRFRFLLLRRQRINGNDRSVNNTDSHFEVAYMSPSMPHSGADCFVLEKRENMHEGSNMFKQEVPPGASAVVVLPPLYGETHDCFGWYVEPGGTGAIASWRNDTAQWRQVHALPHELDLGSKLRFGSPLSSSFAVSWSVALPVAMLKFLSRPERVQSLMFAVDVMGTIPGSTSPRFKQDLLGYFSPDSWSDKAVIEVGAAGGATSAVLSTVFGTVYAIEPFVLLPTYPWSPRPRTQGLHNVVDLVLASGRPYALSILARNDIRAAVIDGDHDAFHVFLDTFSVLHDIPCCIEIIVFHDFCDADVFNTIQLFVDAGLLRFRKSVGIPQWNMWWCRDGRSEGAIFDTLLDLPSSRRTLEELHRNFSGRGNTAAAVKDLNGSFWTLQDRGELAVLHLLMPPRRAKLYWLPSTGRQNKHVNVGVIDVKGWHTEISNPLWSAEVFVAEIWTERGRSGGRRAVLTFDMNLRGLTLLSYKGRMELAFGLPPAVAGVRHRTPQTSDTTAAITDRTLG